MGGGRAGQAGKVRWAGPTWGSAYVPTVGSQPALRSVRPCFPVAAGREGQPSELRLSSVAGLIGSEEARDREMLSIARLWIASRLPGSAGPDALRSDA